MSLKVDKALDEVEDDKTDPKEAINKGKEIIDKFEDLGFDTVFGDIVRDMDYLFADLKKSLKKAEGETDEKQREKDKTSAFDSAISAVRTADNALKSKNAGVLKSIKKIVDQAAKLKVDKKVDPAMQDVAGMIKTNKNLLFGVPKDIKYLRGELQTLSKWLSNGGMEVKDLASWEMVFAKSGKSYGGTKALKGKLSSMDKAYSKAVKVLKK
jgi:hypothetical protein